MTSKGAGVWAALVCLAALGTLPAQDSAETEGQVARVARGFRYTQGPAWSRDGYLLFSDIPGNKIMKLSPDGTAEVYREDSGGASGNAFDDQGRLYTCETHTRRVTRTDKKGRVEVLAERFEGKRFNAPSAIVVSKAGHVYFTDPAFGSQQDTREMDFNGVYHITPKGQISLVAKYAGRPAGIALSPNGKTLFVANADERNIRAWDLDREGAASGERVWVARTDGIPRGMHAGTDGKVYVAAHGVAVYNAEGKLLLTIPVAEEPSNCALGDADGESLYITARTCVYRVRVKALFADGR